MSRAARLYFVIALSAVGLNLAGLALYVLSWPEITAVVENPLVLLETPEPLAAFLAVTGLLIVIRRPENAVGRLLIAIGLFSGLFVFATGYSIYSQLAMDLPGGAVACRIGTWSWFPSFGLLVSWLMLLYPDGRPPSPKWRGVAWMGMGLVALGTLGAATQPIGSANLPVPVSCYTPPVAFGGPLLGMALIAVLPLGLLGLVALVRKAMGGGPVIRAQVKWFALATGLLVVAVAGREMTATGSTLHVAFVVLAMLAVIGVPVAIGVAILRYRLYEIDRLVSRTVAYGLLTAVLLASYFGLVFVMRDLLPFSGSLPIALSTLAVAAVFAPLRRWIQSWVDRRFNRSRYDPEQVVDRFGEVLHSQAAVEDLHDELKMLVATTLEPSQVSLWLLEDNQ